MQKSPKSASGLTRKLRRIIDWITKAWCR